MQSGRMSNRPNITGEIRELHSRTNRYKCGFRVWRGFIVASLALLLTCSTAMMAQTEMKKPDAKEEKTDELLLKAAGKVEFETNEGTWMSVDLSPDNQTIVFDLLGDLYTIPARGGTATKIVGGMSFESQPKFSPDGKLIAFLSDKNGGENLWVCNADGTNAKPITKTRHVDFCSPSWTPDGKYILVSKKDGFDTYSVWMYHKDGGTGVTVGSPLPPISPTMSREEMTKRPSKIGAVASPDGRFIYYAQRPGMFSYNVMFPMWQITRFDRENSDAYAITNTVGSAIRPVLSPDGKKLVYGTRYDAGTALRIRDIQTNEERWLVNPVTRDDQESVASRDTLPGYCFTSDSKSLILSVGGKIQKCDVETGKLAEIPFTAKVSADIAPRLHFDYRVDQSANLKSRIIRWPHLSPDGKTLVFGALNKVWTVDVTQQPRAGSMTAKRLTNSGEGKGEFSPIWSPDGSAIVYVSWTTEGGQIMRVPSDGSAPAQPLTRHSALYMSPAFTPDGTKVVFLTGSVDAQRYSTPHNHDELEILTRGAARAEITGLDPVQPFEIRWVPAQGGGESTYVALANGASGLHFGPTSDRVYMTMSGEPGSIGLGSIRLDGQDRRMHVKVTGHSPSPIPPGPSEIVISPDGERVFVDLQNRHYLLELPKVGKETLSVSIAGAAPSSVLVKKLSTEGGSYLGWSADSKSVTWAWGSKFMRQDIMADAPHVVDVAVEAKRAVPTGTVVLSGARIVSMKGDEVIENGDVVVTGNRIAEVGEHGKVTVPKGAKVISARGKTIIPGFVDVHSHMWPPRDLNQSQVWQYMANLAYGVTTTRDPQSSTTDIFNYSDLVETGEILGPRIFTTGPGVFNDAGLDDKEAVLRYLKRYKEGYKTDTLKEYMSGDRLVRQWVALACKELKITPTTEGALDLKLDLSQMIDGFSGSEHALPIQPLYKDVTQFVAKSDTYYTPTILVGYGAPDTENLWFESTDVHNDPKLRRFVPHAILDPMVRRRKQWFMADEYGHVGIAKGCADVVHAGGHVCLGSHGQLQGLGAHWEIWSLASGGMTPLETLRCATLFGAQAIGLAQDLGSIEAGKLADLIVLDNNPLKDIKNTRSIKWVMKNGEMYEGETLDQVWPIQKKLEKPFWWDQDPAGK